MIVMYNLLKKTEIAFLCTSAADHHLLGNLQLPRATALGQKRSMRVSTA
jgi:hypothetical protein